VYCAAGAPPSTSAYSENAGAQKAPLEKIDRTSEAIPSCIVALSLGTLPSP
jgi:hypothetical protein